MPPPVPPRAPPPPPSHTHALTLRSLHTCRTLRPAPCALAVVRNQASFSAYVDAGDASAEASAAATDDDDEGEGGAPLRPAFPVPTEAPWEKTEASVFDKLLPVRPGGPYKEGQASDAYWKLLKQAHNLQAYGGHCVGDNGAPLRQAFLRRAISHDPANPYG